MGKVEDGACGDLAGGVPDWAEGENTGRVAIATDGVTVAMSGREMRGGGTTKHTNDTKNERQAGGYSDQGESAG